MTGEAAAPPAAHSRSSLAVHLGPPVQLEELLDKSWEEMAGQATSGVTSQLTGCVTSDTLVKAVREFQQQAVAGMVGLGPVHEVRAEGSHGL